MRAVRDDLESVFATPSPPSRPVEQEVVLMKAVAVPVPVIVATVASVVLVQLIVASVVLVRLIVAIAALILVSAVRDVPARVIDAVVVVSVPEAVPRIILASAIVHLPSVLVIAGTVVLTTLVIVAAINLILQVINQDPDQPSAQSLQCVVLVLLGTLPSHPGRDCAW